MSFWYTHVLGLARTGLIFTRIQEGAQPGGLTPPGQTEPGIPYHVLSRWVPVGGAARQELTRGSGVCGAGPVRESGSVGSCSLFCVFPLSVSLLLLFPFLCCSVKLPLSQPTGFLPVSFHSPPHRGGGRGGRVALLLPVAAETKTTYLGRANPCTSSSAIKSACFLKLQT